MDTTTKGRPATNRAANQEHSGENFEATSSLPESAVPRAQYAVHVVATRRDGVQVGQTFATLAAAEKKIRRQRERELPVQATLVRLVPVPWSVIGGELL